MVSQNGVSDANAYQSISVTTLSDGAQASRQELEQIILLLELLNAEPGDAQAEALIEQLAASNLTSEELRALLTDAGTAGHYGMESLYAVTEEKYAYALSDYFYAVSSLEHWDQQIANMDSWAGNASLAVSAVGLGVKLGGAGVNAITQAYKAGDNLSGIWSSAKKALKNEAMNYAKDFKLYKTLTNYKKLENLTEYWKYIKEAVTGAGTGVATAFKNAVNLKPYKDLLQLVRTVKAGNTAAAGLKGLDGMVESGPAAGPLPTARHRHVSGASQPQRRLGLHAFGRRQDPVRRGGPGVRRGPEGLSAGHAEPQEHQRAHGQ